MSLFRRKKSTTKLKSSERQSPLPPTSSGSFNAPLRTESTTLHFDDFGRPVNRPAFSTGELERTFDTGYGLGEDREHGSPNGASPPQEMQLLYGYAPLGTQLELGVQKVEHVVNKCAMQIRQRGLDTPLIMSSRALDISSEGVCSLIRGYLEDISWEKDLEFATPLAIGAFLKWALARLVNNQGARGFCSWDAYREFRNVERSSGYQQKSCSTYLLARLSTASCRLLTSLLSLFSSIAAHSAKNGMPPRKLASLFSPYIFGLADDQTFDDTYDEWQRATDATEHILLAFIRDQQADAPLPTFLERYIDDYPSMLNIDYVDAPPKVPEGAKVEEVTRIQRWTRFHSRNLIASASTWDIPHSPAWQSFFNHNAPTSLASSTSSTSSPLPVYSSAYRHLLNIRANSGLEDELEGEYEQGRYKTRLDKEWSKFGESGFSNVDEKKLEFDLTEGERAVHTAPKQPIDWDTFETTGFAGRELFAPNDLVFQQTLSQRVKTYPSSVKTLNDRLRAAEKLLPAFPYDTTPHEEPRVLIDSMFFEAWADVLVGGGWARDELKHSSFALIQWKSRPTAGGEGSPRPPKSLSSSSGDPRTEDRWVLVEEFVPREYREALTDPKAKKESRRISFLRTVRRKHAARSTSSPSSAVLLSPSLGSPRGIGNGIGVNNAFTATSSPKSLRPIDESVFTDNHAETTKVSLSSPLEHSTYAPTSYAPSIISTVVANDGHTTLSNLNLTEQGRSTVDHPRSPPAAVPAQESYHTHTLSKSPKRGLLARINTMRKRESPPEVASNRDYVWADARPNAPPILGAVSPPPLPPKTPDLVSPPIFHYPTHEPAGDSRASTLTVSTNPYGGIDDGVDTREMPDYGTEDQDGEVLFRGSQSYSHGRSGTNLPQDRNSSERTPPPIEKDMRLGSSASHSLAKTNGATSRPPYLSGVSSASSRVTNIVGLYEQRDDNPTQSA